MSIKAAICGPMCSNKSGNLISRCILHNGKKMMVGKNGVIHSRNGSTIIQDCMTHNEFIDLYKEGNLCPDTTYFIDEAQFIDGLSKIISSSSSTFVVSMLDMNFEGKPYREYIALVSMSKEVTHLRAICDKCGRNATHSFKDPEREETLDKSAYSPRCLSCFKKGMSDYVEFEEFVQVDPIIPAIHVIDASYIQSKDNSHFARFNCMLICLVLILSWAMFYNTYFRCPKVCT